MLGLGPAAGVLGFVGSPAGWLRAQPGWHFPNQPWPASWGAFFPQFLLASAVIWFIFVGGLFEMCLWTSHFLALACIVVMLLTKNTGLPLQERAQGSLFTCVILLHQFCVLVHFSSERWSYCHALPDLLPHHRLQAGSCCHAAISLRCLTSADSQLKVLVMSSAFSMCVRTPFP